MNGLHCCVVRVVNAMLVSSREVGMEEVVKGLWRSRV